jgi:hypothetical protein
MNGGATPVRRRTATDERRLRFVWFCGIRKKVFCPLTFRPAVALTELWRGEGE